ncbi:MAG: DUF2958 domain-containing protein [Phycisphaerae bacterium]|nr:DUF2958 domain-containing protein [Phycisphaerae bacterium]
MAWRPNDQFIEGELDNSVPNKVTGWMRFVGMKEIVRFELEGNFHRDIRGAIIKLHGDGESANAEEAEKYMHGFSTTQTGNAGDITAGREPCDYGLAGSAYIEWYSKENGRVVLELDTEQVELLTQPIPACESEPIDRKKQNENMAKFLCGMAQACGIPETNAIAIAGTQAVERAKKVIANDKIRGMKLLPREIRENLPSLYSQDGKGGKAIVYAKYFCASSSWIWFVLEGEPVLDEAGKQEIDFKFFGLVDGLEKELGYFLLSELEEVSGPFGLPIERDLYWQPKTLAQIVPELFDKEGQK